MDTILQKTFSRYAITFTVVFYMLGIPLLYAYYYREPLLATVYSQPLSTAEETLNQTIETQLASDPDMVLYVIDDSWNSELINRYYDRVIFPQYAIALLTVAFSYDALDEFLIEHPVLYTAAGDNRDTIIFYGYPNKEATLLISAGDFNILLLEPPSP